MKREIFMWKFVQKGSYREITHYRRGLPWIFWRILIEKTRKIDYGCDFNNGGCKRNRERKQDQPMCCCTNCKNRMGFFNVLNWPAIEKIAPLYNEETGFWKEGIGCSLPIDIRSVTCVTYRCGFLRDPMYEHKLELYEEYLLERIRKERIIAEHYKKYKNFERGRRNGILTRKGDKTQIKVFSLTDRSELFNGFLAYDFKMWKEGKRWWKGRK